MKGNNQKGNFKGGNRGGGRPPGKGGMRGGIKTVITPHRFPGVYTAKGTQSLLVTKNFVPG